MRRLIIIGLAAALRLLLEASSFGQVVSRPEELSNATVLPVKQLQETNLQNASNAVVCSDVMEQVLLRQINQYRQLLEKTNFSAASRQFQEMGLKDLQKRLVEHTLRIQSNAAANLPDPIEQSLSSQVAGYERELSDPAIAPERRSLLQGAMVDFTQMRDAHRLNVSLWANLTESRESKDSGQLARAERELADYLAMKLGRIQGKTYPADMGLDGIMAEYKKAAPNSYRGDNRAVVRGIIIFVCLTPLLIIACIRFVRGRKEATTL